MIDFDDDGTVRIKTQDDTIDGDFTYDADEEEGEIESSDDNYDGLTFKLGSDYLKLDGEKYYRDKEEAGYGEENGDEDGDEQPQEDASLAAQIVGIWQVVEATYGSETQDVSYLGSAFEFAAGGSVTEYESYEQSETGAWEVLEGGALQLTASDGDVITFDNIVMDEDGSAFTADATDSDGMTGSMRFVKKNKEAFAASANDLLPRLPGFWWLCGSSDYPPVDSDVLGEGLAIEFRGMVMDFYDEFEVDIRDIGYEFVDADTIHFFEDGSEYTVDVSFEPIGGQEYLAMTSDGETTYFISSSYDDYMAADVVTTIPAISDVDMTYTSDADIRALIVREWNQIYFLDANGTQDEDIFEYNTKLYADGTFDEIYDGEELSGQWTVEDGVISFDYSNGDLYIWSVVIEYKTDMQAYLLYFEVLGENQQGTGEYLVLTDYQP